ncbi:hypothetical protein AWW67_02125 [Roseivirga seohaensis]|uniref:7-cyano-7-deazaguanine synthase n=1 Tax=Roseivirga seohaensis TaxID=1914963 RepID=A0A150XYW2_9BACT|nr:Qat anti-phage system QueC-like protein QatC [Roseivirga seohaensis]KYG83937.1 hypothetical protein AWW67_02125 [Roseivirga seohaensis]
MMIKIKVEASTPIVKGQFGDVKISYLEDGVETKASLSFPDFERLYDFTKETDSIEFDLFLISSIIYAVDDLFARKVWSFNGWTRDFELEIPVRHTNKWASVKSEFEDMLSFLTGDLWTLTFKPLLVSNLYLERTNRRKKYIPVFDYDQYKFASLFSGGLDSLMGVINELKKLGNKEKGVLISHFDSTYSGPKTDQDQILSKFAKHYPGRYEHIRTRVKVESKLSTGKTVSRDLNQRSRSLLFISLGLYLIRKMPKVNELIIPENGTISLNHPLTPSRSSSLSTRTTHPFFLSSLENILLTVGVTTRLFNPFEFMTKGSMVDKSSDKTVLMSTYKDSKSCGKRGHKYHWDNREAGQCGVCMPCIYRRAALHAKFWDNEDFGIDLLKATAFDKLRPDIKALFDFLKTDLDNGKIKRNLLVDGNIEQSKLDVYADVVVNSRKEIIKWISDKGNSKLKKHLGL